MWDLTFDDVTRYATTCVHPRVSPRYMGYVPPPLVPVNASRNSNISIPWAMTCTEYPCRCFYWWQLPVWAQYQFVGVDTAKEAVAAYYRAMQSNRLGNRLDELEYFLTIDHFHLGVKPYDHIRRLEIHLDTYKRNLQSFYEVLDLFGKDSYALYKVRAMGSIHLSLKLL
jgi:hypothetical protein